MTVSICPSNLLPVIAVQTDEKEPAVMFPPDPTQMPIIFLKVQNNLKTGMAASVLKQDPNTKVFLFFFLTKKKKVFTMRKKKPQCAIQDPKT